MLLRLAYLGVANVFALLRLLPMSSRDKDAEILRTARAAALAGTAAALAGAAAIAGGVAAAARWALIRAGAARGK